MILPFVVCAPDHLSANRVRYGGRDQRGLVVAVPPPEPGFLMRTEAILTSPDFELRQAISLLWT